MAKYAVNEEGIAAMRTVGSQTLEAMNCLYQESSKIISLSDNHSDLLGPHKSSLNSAVLEILTELKAAAAPINEITETLNDIADSYEEIINNDSIQATSAAAGSGLSQSGVGGASSGGSFANASPTDTVKNTGAAWAASLNADYEAAVRAYTGSAYQNINATLRGLEGAFIGANGEIAQSLHQTLQSAELPCACTVYRGTSGKALGNLRFLPDSMLVGKTIMEDAFMSTSLSENDAFGGDILLVIEAPAGSHGAYVGNISALGHSESEVLFDAGQIMTITGAHKDGSGRRIVNVRILK